MRATILFKGIIVLFAFLATTEQLSASCGSASCPLNSFRYLKSGWLHVGLTHEYINQDRIYIGTNKSFVGAIGYHHDEVQTINERNALQLQSGISDRLGVNIEIPFVNRQHSHIHHHLGEDVWESWSFSGLGDMVVSGQYSVLLPESDFDPYLTVLAGVKLPTGITDIKNAEGEEAEASLQPGSGSTDGIFGVNYRQPLASIQMLSGDYSELPLIAGFTYQINGSGTNGWKFGNTLHAHIGTSYQFSHRATLLLQFNGRFQDFADIGATREPGENTGGTWIYASPGLSLELTEDISGYAYVQVPVYQNVHGIQQTSAMNIQLGFSANIGLMD